MHVTGRTQATLEQVYRAARESVGVEITLEEVRAPGRRAEVVTVRALTAYLAVVVEQYSYPAVVEFLRGPGRSHSGVHSAVRQVRRMVTGAQAAHGPYGVAAGLTRRACGTLVAIVAAERGVAEAADLAQRACGAMAGGTA